MQDEEIVLLYELRQETAIMETDNAYGKLLTGFSFHIVNDYQDAEECVSDTYLRTWDSIPPNHPNSLKAYLLRIVRNISLNCVRTRKSKKRGGGEYQVALDELLEIISGRETEDIVDAICLRDALNDYLNDLPKEKKAIFMARYWYFNSIKEIAKNLCISESKVKMSLCRCRDELKSHLKKEGFEL